jgi:hypothetical protein
MFFDLPLPYQLFAPNKESKMQKVVPPSAIALLLSTTLLTVPAQAQTNTNALPFGVIIPEFTEDQEAAMAVASTRNAWRETFERQDVDGIMEFYVPDSYSFDLMAAPEGDGLNGARTGLHFSRCSRTTYE